MYPSILLAPLLLRLLPLTTATAIPNPLPVAVAQPISKPMSSPPSILFAPPATTNPFADYAFDKCKELGIDPHGSHPVDFTREDANGRHFVKGSRYSFWAAAQSSDKMDEGNGKRGIYKHINAIMWTDDYCSQNGYHIYNLDEHPEQFFFDANPTDTDKDRYSISITSGVVYGDKWRIHLKTWLGPGSSACSETYMYATGGKGCYPNTRKFSCVQLMYQPK
ncbi:hypothetical protein K440DRAFT_623266 [Wilcoxina mikolae CBS 423.85]|nr:hypothetical protein K440DRAFT_623266 [Wilcoxina mikolae CBS 423.85]